MKALRRQKHLFLVRQHDYLGALDLLRQASELAPDNARYAYGLRRCAELDRRPKRSNGAIGATHQRHPAVREVLMALIAIAQSAGDVATALRHAREMAALHPADPQFRKLVSDLVTSGLSICCLSRAK